MPLGDDLGPSRRAAASQWQQDQTSAAVSAWLLGGDQATVAAASGDLVAVHALVAASWGLGRNAAAGNPARRRAASAV